MSSKPWRRPLTMSNQMSETRAQFSGQPELISRVLPDNDPQPPSLRDHFIDGVTKVSFWLAETIGIVKRVALQRWIQGGYLGSAEPPFYHFARMRRRPRVRARAQSKMFWTAEPQPPPFIILDPPLHWMYGRVRTTWINVCMCIVLAKHRWCLSLIRSWCRRPRSIEG